MTAKKKAPKKKTARKAAKKATKKAPKPVIPDIPEGTPLDTQCELSPSEEKFVNAIIDGENATQAYLIANPKVTKESAGVQGHRLLKNVKISEEIHRIRALLRTGKTLSRQRKREILADIAEGAIDEVKVSDRTNAINIDNKMTGDEKPIRIEGEVTLSRIIKGINSSTGLPTKE